MTDSGSNIDVSVIVLTYNQKYTAGRAIDSILSQRRDFSMEIVVSDDASTDGTREVCEQYARDYPAIVRLLPAEGNRGVVLNYFHALSHCRGRFIADCAGDDYWLGDDSLMAKYHKIEAVPNAVLVYSPWSENRMENVMTPQELHDGRDLTLALLEHRRPVAVHLSTVLYRASVARQCLAENANLVCNTDFACEDLPLLCALLSKGDALYYPKSTLLYTVREGSVSFSGSYGREAEFHLATSMATALLGRAYGVDSADMQKSMRRKLQYSMGQALMADDGDLRDRIVRTVCDYRLPVSFKYKMARLLSSNRAIWRIIKKLRQACVR